MDDSTTIKLTLRQAIGVIIFCSSIILTYADTKYEQIAISKQIVALQKAVAKLPPKWVEELRGRVRAVEIKCAKHHE